MWFIKSKIGLALGSGTARGLAHIGILKVLHQEKIKIDYISGASIGALIGAVYSMYEDTEILQREALAVDWLRLISYVHLGYGQGGLMDNKKVEDFIRHFVGNKTFRDLKIPLAIVASDLEKGTTVVFKDGPLWEAIRASIALPFLLSPFQRENRLLVDGGLLSPLPVAACRSLGADRVIAVNLFSDLEGSYKKFLLTELNKTASTINTVIQAFFIMEHKLARIEGLNAALVLEPALGPVEWFDFTQARNCIKFGETAAREKLPEIRKFN